MKLDLAKWADNGLKSTGAILDGHDFNEWLEAGRLICEMVKRSPWWIGDWINYAETTFLSDKPGNRKYGIKYSAALEMTGIEKQLLKDFAWVAKAVNVSRRRDDLPFSFHREVAPLSAKEQSVMLALCASKGWSRSELRMAIRARHKTVTTDEPSVSIGFMPSRWAHEGLRGIQMEIDRLGPISEWDGALRRSWKSALKPVVEPLMEIYEKL